MAANRIVRASGGPQVLHRCKSEATLDDLRTGVRELGLSGVRGPSPSALRLEASSSSEAAQEVVALRDYCPTSFTTLRFSKGERLFVLDTSGGDWWYAHNNREMGFIPSAYVRTLFCRDSSLSDSGVMEHPGEGCDGGELGEWTGVTLTPISRDSKQPFASDMSLGCSGTGVELLDQNHRERTVRKSADLTMLDRLSPQPSDQDSVVFGPRGNSTSTGTNQEHRDNPLFRSKRCYSLSELSVLQAQADPTLPPGFFTGPKAPSQEQFQSREDFRTAWLNHRKLTRSCHNLDSLGQNPGWGQTQPVETNIVCRLDCNGGVVQLPDTNISVLIPEGHVSSGDTQQISLKALLDPPLELNGDRCSTVSPVVEIKLSNMETKSFITLEMRVSVMLKRDGGQAAEVLCVRSVGKEGPYTPVPNAYVYKDTVQVQLDSLEPCMYVAVVVQAMHIGQSDTVWDYVQKKVTLALYGPKHIHPSFKTVIAVFGHDCAPKTLLVNEVVLGLGSAPPVVLQLWGKHPFILGSPQDLRVGLYSNMSNYEVKAEKSGGVIRGFQVKLGKVGRVLHTIRSRDPDRISDFTLRVQVKDSLDHILAQFCVQTPRPPPQSVSGTTGPRRFLKKKELDRIVLSPLALASKHPLFQDRCITNLKFGKLMKTVIRQHKNTYLLEYKKGDAVALLSEEKIKLRGQLWTKEWYIGYYQGKVGLVHAKNVLVLGKVKPVRWSGPDLTATLLLEQILKPCKFLTYVYASVRTVLMENVGDWRSLADALGYGNRPLDYFCWTEPDHEPEKVASVLEKLKEECTNSENKESRSFQRELFMALLKMDLQGLAVRLLVDLVLLTASVELGPRWRDLAQRLAHVSPHQMDAYEAPHRDKNGLLDTESMWKPAYDFLLRWAAAVGDCSRDVLQELQLGLDRMRSPASRRWRHLAGVLLLVHALDPLRSAAFWPRGVHRDAAI
ncbi:hypothetical protein NHX12_014535 [Muraenolepis orangiensis]|uniref:SH3 domain-binding protein 4 n=1 Tax=Muraenolepis orangiensis TaxID=630683 RepID=A0A9Q0D8V7_9TELE|nr:hypothetical protein NHX12_014535 [Muraenolepis orangiensis]